MSSENTKKILQICLWKRNWLAQKEESRLSPLATSLKELKKIACLTCVSYQKLAALNQLHRVNARGVFLQCEGYEHMTSDINVIQRLFAFCIMNNIEIT